MIPLLEVITAPTLRCVTLQEAKDFLRLTADDENALVEALIDAARDRAELEAGRTLLTTTLELRLAGFPDVIPLLRPPVQSVTSVTYYDTAGAAQVLTATTEYLAYCGTASGYLYLPDGATWPTTYDRPDAVLVRYVAGWTTAALVPACVRAWVLQAVATLYENREQVVTGTISSALPRDFCAGLLDPVRCYTVL